MLADLKERLTRKYRQRVHPALRATLRRVRTVRPKEQSDLVSVVIPVYNVEEYLADCLTSVVEQTYKNLEIIIVDDGSPDRSYKIARSYARWDPRIRVIRRQNGGLGAARNTGIRNANGRYLSFVDSDDTLPANAIAVMARSLRATGSDFAVGAPLRFGNGRVWSSGWVKEVHAVDRQHVTLDEFPDILKDVFAWNKLFDAAFFHRVVGGFPEGIRYEDQEPTAKAYVAGTFDVLSASVYHWRVRDDGSSITQQKSELADLHDRLTVKNRVADIISAGASLRTHEMWLAKAIGFDLRPYFEQVPRTDGEFFEQLRAGVRGLASRMTPAIWKQVGIIDRIPALAVLAGYPEDVTTAVTRRDEYGWFVPTRARSDGIFLDRRFLEGMRSAPADELIELGTADLKVVARATSVWWHDTTLRIEGYAYLTNLPSDPEATTTTFTLISDDGLRVPVVARRRPDPRIDIETKDSWNSHREAGLVVDINPTELPLTASEVWRIEVAVSGHGYSSSTILRDFDPRGIAGTRPVAPAVDGVRWMAGFEDGEYFTLRRTTDFGAAVTAIATDGRSVTLTVDDPAATTLRLTCRSRRRTVEVSEVRHQGTRAITFAVSLPELLSTENLAVEHLWSMLIHGECGEPRRLTYGGGADDLDHDSPEHGRVRVVMTRAGTIRLAQNLWWAVADEVIVEARALVVCGRILAPGAADLQGRMVGRDEVIVASEVHLAPAEQTFSLRFPFDTDGSQPTTRYGFSVRLSVELDGRRQERWLRVSTALQHQFPSDAEAERYGITLTRTNKACGLWVRFRPRFLPDERGRLAQRRLHDHFRRPASVGGGLAPALRDAVLFETFNGRSASDSVLSLHQELRTRDLGLEFFWSVADPSTTVPDGATPLLMHSRAWMDALHNCRYLVNNNNFPFYYRKHEGQTYIQTWHGTPLKRIGNDVPGANLSLPYRRLMVREAEYWDVLLAQNEFAAEILPKAFGYDGRVLDLGYPRNDALAGPEAVERRRKARLDLGLADDQLVLLYAPTWRDNVSITTGYAMVSYLDYRMVRRTLGNRSVVLLRGHANTAHQTVTTPDGVLDVTRHPDVNDLMLASDVMITDYSSMMFDYCVTGKPIMFLTPDLEQYRDVTRGFYLDFEEIAPGPICRTSEQLSKRLASLDETIAAHTTRYHSFAKSFAPRDDGHATARVVDAIWGSGS